VSDPADVRSTPLVERFQAYRSTTFSALKVRNYRLYFLGQGISLIGTWMQGVGQAWLVYKLSGSGTTVGIVAALQFLPVFFLAPFGGVLADRFPKRRMLLFTQTFAAVLALTLGLLVATGSIKVWMIGLLALGLGIVNSLDNPVRQSFISEIVGLDELRNGVTLNSLEVNLCRIIGPAIAGVVIVKIGIALCFFTNAASFVAVIACLALMRERELQPSKRVAAARGQIRAGLKYAWSSPTLRTVLFMMALVGTLTYEFNVTLVLLAGSMPHGNAGTYALLTSAMGLGAVLGGLMTAGRRTAALRGLVLSSFGFGLTMLMVAASPSIIAAALFMIAVGACSLVFTSLTNTILQMESAQQMRGRVMSLWTVAFLGSTVFGAPIVGWIGQHFSPRASISVGAAAALLAGIIGLSAMRKTGRVFDATCEPAPFAEKEEYE
jgi:MFS family permease